MIAHGKDIKIFSGNSNRALAENICRELGTQLGNAAVSYTHLTLPTILLV